MPLQKVQFRPGMNRESTNYSNEGGFWACDKIRFRSGFPEKLGGWVNESFTYTFKGVARTLWNWVTATGSNLLAVGTSQKYYIQNSSGGQFYDITPIQNTATLSNPFTTTNGSKLVLVAATGHGATQYTYVTFSGASAVGGLTLNGEYEIVSVPDSNSYYIVASSAATSSAGPSGGSVTATYQLSAGNIGTTYGSGWGGGTWGSNGWGVGAPVTINTTLRLWSQDNYGEDLIMNPRGGPIYYWAKNTSTFNRATLLSSYANSEIKFATNTLAASAATTTILYVQSTDGIDYGAVVTGSANIPGGAYVTALGNYVSASNSFEVYISAAILTGGVSSGVTLSFSYAGRAVPNQTNYVVASDTSHFTIALGANPYDPTDFNTAFDPMLVRWSDQANPSEWTPRQDNQSGEQHLSNGSKLVAAQNTRQEILVWSDTALYSMQYLGPPYVWGFNLLMDNISIISPNAGMTVNSVTYWMGVDKFYMYSGRVETLPCTLRNYVFMDINKDQYDQVVCGTNEGYNEVWWFYPSADSLINNRYVIYNHLERIWYYGTMNRTAWLDSPLRDYPMGSFSVQTTYTNAAITSTATSIPVISSTTYPPTGTVTLDSEQITYTGISSGQFTGCTRGVNNTTAVSHVAYTVVSLNQQNQIIDHEVGVDDGTVNPPIPMEAYIESSDFDIGDGHNFGFVWRMLPDLSFVGSTVTSLAPVVYLSLKAKTNSGTTYYTAYPDTRQAVTAVIPVSADEYTGEVFTRIRGRQMSFKIASTALGVDWQLGATRIDLRPDGRR